jgi:outer membrane protein assembly factor BamB
VVAAAALLSTLGVTGGSASGTARQHAARAGAARASQAAAVPGAQLWAAEYSGSIRTYSEAYSVAASPTGKTVFVTGESLRGSSRFDYATVAYNAATGAQLWAKRYNGPGNGADAARSVAVSPAGGKVFVTGRSYGAVATVAYNAATGAWLWGQRYDQGGGESVTVSPTGDKIFVTGDVGDPTPDFAKYLTIAYSG